MAGTEEQFSIEVETSITKYAEGVTPETGEPYEVVKQKTKLVGQDAYDYLASIGHPVPEKPMNK